MWSFLGRWSARLLLAMAAASVAAYAADWAIFCLSGSPSSTVTVNRYLSVPLKGHKEEFDYLGASQVVCSVSLFPQGDKDPCWLVWRNRNQWEAP